MRHKRATVMRPTEITVREFETIAEAEMALGIVECLRRINLVEQNLAVLRAVKEHNK